MHPAEGFMGRGLLGICAARHASGVSTALLILPLLSLSLAAAAGSAESGGASGAQAAVSREATAPRPSIRVVSSLAEPEAIFDDANRHESVVGLALFERDSGEQLAACSGTLINPRTVLTAAHCVRFEDRDGDFDRNLGVAVVTDPDAATALEAGDVTLASSHVVPQAFQRDAFELGHDVALLGLGSRLDAIEPTRLVDAAPAPGTEVTLVGFGEAGSEDPDDGFFDFRRRAATNTLRLIAEFEGSTLPDGLLFTSFDDPDAPPDEQFPGLATSATTLEGTTASGDSGGPLLIESDGGELQLAGVTSGGFTRSSDSETDFGDIDFFSNIAVLRSFIDARNPLIESSAVAGDGDWLDAGHWESGRVPDNFDPLAEEQDPTLPAAFFEVELHAPGRTMLADGAVEIDSLAVTGTEAAMALDDARFDVVDRVTLAGGRLELAASELAAQGMILDRGSMAIGPESTAVASVDGMRAGLRMRGGALSVRGQFLGGRIQLQGGELTVAPGGRLADSAGSMLLGGRLLVEGELATSGLLLDGAELRIGAAPASGDPAGLVRDTGDVSTLAGGSLFVEGRFEAGALGFTGGRLGGGGVVAAPQGLLQQGGMLAPGGEDGRATLTIRGDLQQTPEATTLIGVAGADDFDRLHIRAFDGDDGGQALLDGTVQFGFVPGFAPGRGAELTFIAAERSLESRAETSGGPLAADGAPTALRMQERIDVSNGEGTAVVAAAPYDEFADSPQQRAVARLLDGAGTPIRTPEGGLGEVAATLDTLGVEGDLQQALQSMNPTQAFLFDRFGFQLSRVMANTVARRAGLLAPEGGARRAFHGPGVGNDAAAQAVAPVDSRLLRAAARLDAVASAEGASGGDSAPGRPAWGGAQAVAASEGFFVAGDWLGGEATQVDGKADLGAHFVTVGIDRRLGEQALIGLAGSHAKLTADRAGPADAEASGWGIGLYGGLLRGPLHARIYLGHHWLTLESTRELRLDPPRPASAESDGRVLAGGVELAGRFPLGRFEAGPLLQLRHVRLSMDALEEEQAGPFAVLMPERDAHETLLGLGGQGGFEWEGERHRTDFFARLTWQHRLTGERRFDASAQLLGGPGHDFAVPGASIDGDYGSYTIGVTSVIDEGLSLQLSFESDFARDRIDERRISLGAKMGL